MMMLLDVHEASVPRLHIERSWPDGMLRVLDRFTGQQLADLHAQPHPAVPGWPSRRPVVRPTHERSWRSTGQPLLPDGQERDRGPHEGRLEPAPPCRRLSQGPGSSELARDSTTKERIVNMQSTACMNAGFTDPGPRGAGGRNDEPDTTAPGPGTTALGPARAPDRPGGSHGPSSRTWQAASGPAIRPPARP